MDPVHPRVLPDQFGDHFQQIAADPLVPGVEPIPAVGEQFGFVVRQRLPGPVPGDDLAAEPAHHRRGEILPDPEHVHPGVNLDAGGVRFLEQVGERIHLFPGKDRPVGGGVGDGAVEPGPVVAVDLDVEDVEIAGAGTLHQLVDPFPGVEGGVGPLALDPEAPGFGPSRGRTGQAGGGGEKDE